MVINDRHLQWLGALKSVLERHRRSLLTGLIGLFVVVVVGQLLYPQSKALPLARMGGESVALQTEETLSAKVHTLFQDATVTVQSGDKRETTSLAEAGAELEGDRMVREATDYPLWQRFIPFSILFRSSDIGRLQVDFNQDQLTEYAQKVASQLTVVPVDAALSITEGKLVVTEPHDGRVVTADMVREQVQHARFTGKQTTLQLQVAATAPKRGMKDIEPVRSQAERYIAHEITLKDRNDKSIVVEPIDIAKWLTTDTDESGKVILAIKDDAVSAYTASIASQVDVKPGVAKAKLVDGVEVGRTAAASGLGVDQSKLAEALKAAVASEPSAATIKLVMNPVAPTVSYDRSYSSSRAGLQAYVDYIGQSSNTRIVITQLDGNGWSVGARANEGTVAASTYKVFLSLVLFDKIRTGDLHWNDSIQGYDMATCLEKTIVLSANECAEELIGKFGRTNINNFLYGKGMSRATTFTNSTATQSSAADLNRLMIGIHNGTLLSGDDRSNLLEKMGRQIYRRGIPAGSKGSVQDKVGFLWDYLNDSGIVHHPKGTYAMTILTKGSSWENIAQITRDVEGIMYP
jgi:beta-lactamase class A